MTCDVHQLLRISLSSPAPAHRKPSPCGRARTGLLLKSTKKRSLTIAVSSALLGAVVCVVPVASSYDRLNLPQMGEPADLVMSPEDEKQIGRGYMRQIRQYLDLVTDTEINRYVQSIGERLVSTRADLNASDFTFFVVKNPDINAFALPGGYVGVNSGLIMAASNEAELASVIAHETAHITQRHIARLYASQGNSGYRTAATILAAILLSQQSPEAGQAALLTGIAASRQSAIDYTRTHEYEADRIGIQLLSDAGYNPRGMVDFFQVLRRRVSLNTTEQMEFLRTHPLTNNRISEAKNNSARLANPVGLQDTVDFQLHQMKLRVIHTNDPNRMLGALADGHIGKSESARLYGQILLLKQSGKAKKATALVSRLVQLQPHNVMARLLEAEVSDASGETATAERQYQSIIDIYPDHHSAVIGYVDLLLRQRRTSLAERVIQSHIRSVSDPAPAIYKRYANVLRQQGRMVASHEAMADHFLSLDQDGDAVSQLRLALKAAEEGSNEASRINARLERSRFR